LKLKVLNIVLSRYSIIKLFLSLRLPFGDVPY